MPRDTIPDISDQDIEYLLESSHKADDSERVKLCTDALEGNELARLQCAGIIIDQRDIYPNT